MLRTNLSTRPFYNERAVHVVIGAAALLVLSLTVLNVVRILSLSRQNTELSSRITSEHTESDRLRQQAADIRKTINKDELDLVVAAAREANSLIDQRTFSWTAFFNRIESTIPPDVMLTAVRPSFKEGQTRVSLIVLARRPEDIDEFMEKLEATGAFENVVPAQQDRTEQGLYRALIESTYVPPDEQEAEPAPDAPAAAVKPAPTGPEAAPTAAQPAPAAPAESRPPAERGSPRGGRQ